VKVIAANAGKENKGIIREIVVMQSQQRIGLPYH